MFWEKMTILENWKSSTQKQLCLKKMIHFLSEYFVKYVIKAEMAP